MDETGVDVARARRARRAAAPRGRQRDVPGGRRRLAGLIAVADPIKASAPRKRSRAAAKAACASSWPPAMASPPRKAVAPAWASMRSMAKCARRTSRAGRHACRRGPARRHGRRRHQRCAGAGAPMSASPWAPAPTWRCQRPGDPGQGRPARHRHAHADLASPRYAT
jgi:hypothetical protein